MGMGFGLVTATGVALSQAVHASSLEGRGGRIVYACQSREASCQGRLVGRPPDGEGWTISTCIVKSPTSDVFRPIPYCWVITKPPSRATIVPEHVFTWVDAA